MNKNISESASKVIGISRDHAADTLNRFLGALAVTTMPKEVEKQIAEALTNALNLTKPD